MKVRGFERISGYDDIALPQRSTENSAGYDLASAEDIIIPVFEPGVKPVLVKTGLKAYFGSDEVMILANRSSGPIKRGLVVSNGIGIFESDYYNNPQNEGHILIELYNFSDKEVEIKKGERIAQAVFQKFLTIDNDDPGGKRMGGYGSTGK